MELIFVEARRAGHAGGAIARHGAPHRHRLVVIGLHLGEAFLLGGDLGQLAALLFELGGGGGQIGFELALVLAQLSGVDALPAASRLSWHRGG